MRISDADLDIDFFPGDHKSRHDLPGKAGPMINLADRLPQGCIRSRYVAIKRHFSPGEAGAAPEIDA